MRFLDTLQQKAGFTRKEALALLALSGTFIIGLSIRWVQSHMRENPQSLTQFEYSQSDSAYAARAKSASALPQSPPFHNPASSQSTVKMNVSHPKTKGSIVNINTATRGQLMDLPGIGPSYADRIIEYRSSHGQFTSPDELSNIKGIGAKRLRELRPFVRVK